MGTSCAAEDSCQNTSYLHRLVLIYQLISRDAALKATLDSHCACNPPQQQQREAPNGWGGGPCSICEDSHLQARASADVSALRMHLLPAESAAAAAATEQPQPPHAEQQQQQQQQQQQHDKGRPVVSSACRGEALILCYDRQTGGVSHYLPSGLSPVSSSASVGFLGLSMTNSCWRRAPQGLGRVFVDGVFDLLHSGHFNALRQARQLGSCLVVGVNGDAETLAAKGCLPLYTQEERAEIVASCKWVDEVVVGTPYEVSTQLLDALACEKAAHGDDWVVGADGRDAYSSPRAAGRMLTFKRTEGISSTCITRRLLEATAHMCEERVAVDRPQSVGHFARQALQGSRGSMDEEAESSMSDRQEETEAHRATATDRDAAAAPGGPQQQQQQGARAAAAAAASKCAQRPGDWSVFMSSKRLLQFIGEAKKPKPGDRVVYVDGSFDVLHVGHVRILKIAKEMGDYLIVGIHDDATVSRVKGPGFPVMNVNERALNVLAMRMVDEVIIGAPWTIPRYLLETFGIHIVVRGTRIDCIADSLGDMMKKTQRGGTLKRAAPQGGGPPPNNHSGSCDAGGGGGGGGGGEGSSLGEADVDDDPYQVPKELGIYREVESFSSWTTKELVTRLIRNRQALSDSLRHRELKETSFWQSLCGSTARVTAEL